MGKPIKTKNKTLIPRWPSRKTKPAGSSTENTELPIPKLQTETRTQVFGIFKRQEHAQNKYANWSLNPKKKNSYLFGGIKPLPLAQNRERQNTSSQLSWSKAGTCLLHLEKQNRNNSRSSDCYP